jgi:hypothetical protein
MKHSVFGAGALILLLLNGSILGRQSEDQSKGYELYSWKVKGTWHYSLLSGTNRELKRQEILSNPKIKIGDSALRSELKRLPRGEKVFWMSDAPKGVATPSGKRTTSFKQPSRKRIARLKKYCESIGIELILQ